MSRNKSSKRKHSVHWFRKGLRLSDNPALLRAIRRCETFRCIFILDPWFAGSSNVGTNKWRFLLQCLEDLDNGLRKLNSRLFVVRGQPADVLPTLFKAWGTTYFTFEEDPEPFGRVRDQNIMAMCKEMGIVVTKEHSHTLYNLEKIIYRNGGKAPLTYKTFQTIIESMDPPSKPVPTLTLLMLGTGITPLSDDHDEKYGVPTLEELGFDCDHLKQSVWEGGETEALSRLERHLERKAWVASFGRPKMTPQSLLASQTGLSPYLRFGCLSTRLFYHALSDLYRRIKKCDPPLSLHGQLLWREFFYCASTKNPNFDKMVGNPICVQIPWDKNDEALAKWANAQTGFPWIDAIMTQLREEGWIHHLARHAVACFLTRGDLWVSWEEGMKVFDELLLDADWSVNAGSWLWLSCSSFFQQFFHCYCPVKFGRKADANGDYIRRYLPVLKNYPTRYIHEPWTAPDAVQKSARCIIGQDYPKPICHHPVVSKINMERMKQVYQQLAHYRQTGQTGPGIPQDLLNQLPKTPKIPKVPNVTGGSMGPPNPPSNEKKKDGYDCMDQPESSSQIQEQNWIGSCESKFSDQTWIRSKSQDWVGNPEAKVQDQTWIGSSTPIPRASVLTDLQTTIDNKECTRRAEEQASILSQTGGVIVYEQYNGANSQYIPYIQERKNSSQSTSIHQTSDCLPVLSVLTVNYSRLSACIICSICKLFQIVCLYYVF
ncbi:cryptochrome-1 isoform X2 [Eurytemora carolleeae]|uniref:cryptochrome-1 isoform X2 n=1 Tax=Eurytemora carolleeae TaxID=1294199 RepID=UPI000C7950A6|nr:cryptochrome-1 isoform X2 [Eurytemora carolleeae]|eukprot:XP_023329370.1 cryptochrome-1-like isoform X2 [Eurytemora affinis]